MDGELAALKRVHDEAMELGAHCDGGCFFDTSAYDSYKSHKPLVALRARALTLLSTLNCFTIPPVSVVHAA